MKTPRCDRPIRNIFIKIKGRSGSEYKRKKLFCNNFNLSIVNKKSIIQHPIYISVKFFFVESCNSDLDNLLKSVCDALQKSKYIVNDKQIKKINAEIIENTLIDGISIAIHKYDK